MIKHLLWAFRPLTDRPDGLGYISEDGADIAPFGSMSLTQAVNLANAEKCIAAHNATYAAGINPAAVLDLLAACKLLKLAEDYDSIEAAKYAACAAIDKAEGKVATVKRLTENAEADRVHFEGLDGCSCHLSPPCGYCTHPGNPLNQAEDESCWEEVPKDETTSAGGAA